MGAYQRYLVKQQKNFYRDYYRRFVLASMFSLALTVILSLAIFYVYLTRPKIKYYASNTAGFISKLTELPTPNMSSNYLLKPDPQEEITVKSLDVE